MGYSFKPGWAPGDTRPGSLYEWIKSEYPDMTSSEVMGHILNLCDAFQMTHQQLTSWLLLDQDPDKHTPDQSDTA